LEIYIRNLIDFSPGSPSILCGIITFFFLPENPKTCKFLTEREKAWLLSNISKSGKKTTEEIHFADIAQVFCSWKAWAFGIMFTFMAATSSFVVFFLQTLIGEFGFDGLQSNLLTAPVYFFGVLCLGLNSLHSDKTFERPLHVILPLSAQCLAWVGVALCYFYKVEFGYLYCVLLVAVGLYHSDAPPFLAWASQIFKNDTSSAVSTAFILSIGASAPIWSPNIISGLYVLTGSYIWSMVANSGFIFVAASCGIIVAVFLSQSKENTYTILDEDEELSKLVGSRKSPLYASSF